MIVLHVSLHRLIVLVALAALVAVACGKGGPAPPAPAVAVAPLPSPIACYTGPEATRGVGACRPGVQTFPDGPCLGEVVPTPEVCNGRDDDCNGAVDDGLGTVRCGLGACEASAPACVDGALGRCTPAPAQPETCNGVDDDCDGLVDEDCECVHVAPTGDDAAPGTAERPLRTIAAGIRRAAAAGGPRRVCVASGRTCPTAADFTEAIAMVDGVSVSGGYAASGAQWTRGSCKTRIVAQDERGVVFDETVRSPTVLDGFTVMGGDQPLNAAVTIAGSTGAVLANDTIQGGGGSTSYGVNVVASGGHAATPRIIHSTILGGHGLQVAAGIHSFASAPVISENCSAFDAAGRCVAPACKASAGFIRGHDPGPPGQISTGLLLEDSPGAVVAANSVCATAGGSQVAGITVSGAATGLVVRGNHVLGNGGRFSAGVLLQACGGASPWIVDNPQIAGQNPSLHTTAAGVRAVGDCHPRIERNLQIVGNAGGNGDGDGVLCQRADGVSSRCVVEGNDAIVGSLAGLGLRSTGVRCVDACARIARNGRISGHGGWSAVGLHLERAAPLVDANVIEGGCGVSAGTGLIAIDAAARVQNNAIAGALCAPSSAPTPIVRGVTVRLGPGPNELDLHSNTILAYGMPGPCTGRALVFELPQAETGSTRRGLLRNDVLDGGLCDGALAVEEAAPGAGPRVLANDDLWRASAAAPLYRLGDGRELRTVADVEGVAELGAHGNFSAAPLTQVGGLDPASPCRNAGTDEGAPDHDLAGRARPAENRYDVGAFEYVPDAPPPSGSH